MMELYLVPYLAIVLLSMWEMVGNRIARYSTGAILPSQPVSYVSWLRRAINKCELLRTHNRNTVSCMRPTSIEGAPPDL